jgi:hypothetical protein
VASCGVSWLPRLDLARRLGRVVDPTRARHGLVARRHLRRRLDVEVALLDQPFHQRVQQLRDLLPHRLAILALALAPQLG